MKGIIILILSFLIVQTVYANTIAGLHGKLPGGTNDLNITISINSDCSSPFFSELFDNNISSNGEYYVTVGINQNLNLSYNKRYYLRAYGDSELVNFANYGTCITVLAGQGEIELDDFNSTDINKSYVQRSGDQISGRLNITIQDNGSLYPALSVNSQNTAMSAMWLTGNETSHGTLKIAHTYPDADDSSAAALSLVLRGDVGTTRAQGIFLDTSNSTGKAIHLTNGSLSYFWVNSSGKTVITTHDTEGFLIQDTDGGDIFRCNTVSSFCFTTKMIPNSDNAYDLGDNSPKRYRNLALSQSLNSSYVNATIAIFLPKLCTQSGICYTLTELNTTGLTSESSNNTYVKKDGTQNQTGYNPLDWVLRNDWTTHNNYPTGCSGAFVTGIDDTLVCSNAPGFIDMLGNKLFWGVSSDSYIQYDGTDKLIIEPDNLVSGGKSLLIKDTTIIEGNLTLIGGNISAGNIMTSLQVNTSQSQQGNNTYVKKDGTQNQTGYNPLDWILKSGDTMTGQLTANGNMDLVGRSATKFRVRNDTVSQATFTVDTIAQAFGIGSNYKLIFGSSGESEFGYNSTNMVISPDVVTDGALFILGNLISNKNISASYFKGNASQLTDVCLSSGTNCQSYVTSETDPTAIKNDTRANLTDLTIQNNLTVSGNITTISRISVRNGTGARDINLKILSGGQFPTLFSSGYSKLYVDVSNTGGAVLNADYSGYFDSGGFNMNDNNGMILGAGGVGKAPVIYSTTSTQTNGTAGKRMQDIYIGLTDVDYGTNNLASHTMLIGEASNYTCDRKIKQQSFQSLFLLPNGCENNIYGGLQYNNNTLNVITNKGEITLNSTSGVVISNLQATYTSGSAYVCVYDNGTLFASEVACP